MIKVLVGAVLLFNAFALYCCMVVGKWADEDMERMSGQMETDKQQKDTRGCTENVHDK